MQQYCGTKTSADKGDVLMKTLALLLGMILLVCLSPVAASPASPIWPGSVGADGLNSYYFTNDFDPTNRLFQSNDVKVLMFSSPAGNATRYSIGYGIARNNGLGYEQKIFAANINKKISENWWLSVGYESDKLRFGGINFGAGYKISPNATISIFSSFTNKEYDLKKPLLRTQLLIHF